MANSHGRTQYPARLFEEAWRSEEHSFAKSNNKKKKLGGGNVPNYCMALPRILLTRVVVNGFEIETSNRVVRHCVLEKGFDPSSFCRVRMRDERGKQMNFELSNKVTKRMKNILLSGIQVAGQHYCFLGTILYGYLDVNCAQDSTSFLMFLKPFLE